MSTKQITMAVLRGDDERTPAWMLLWGVPRVPIKDEEPSFVVCPDGSERLCYFVDFAILGAKVLAETISKISCENAAVDAMLRSGLYPIDVENVTVVRGPKRLWANCNQAGGEAAG